jgi:hypothetical protein
LRNPFESICIFNVVDPKIIKDIFGMHIDNDQGTKGDTLKFSQFSSHLLNSILELVFKLLEVFSNSHDAFLSHSILNFSCPMHL